MEFKHSNIQMRSICMMIATFAAIMAVALNVREREIEAAWTAGRAADLFLARYNQGDPRYQVLPCSPSEGRPVDHVKLKGPLYVERKGRSGSVRPVLGQRLARSQLSN